MNTSIGGCDEPRVVIVAKAAGAGGAGAGGSGALVCRRASDKVMI
jgi:hypothetical protein